MAAITSPDVVACVASESALIVPEAAPEEEAAHPETKVSKALEDFKDACDRARAVKAKARARNSKKKSQFQFAPKIGNESQCVKAVVEDDSDTEHNQAEVLPRNARLSRKREKGDLDSEKTTTDTRGFLAIRVIEGCTAQEILDFSADHAKGRRTKANRAREQRAWSPKAQTNHSKNTRASTRELNERRKSKSHQQQQECSGMGGA